MQTNFTFRGIYSGTLKRTVDKYVINMDIDDWNFSTYLTTIGSLVSNFYARMTYGNKNARGLKNMHLNMNS